MKVEEIKLAFENNQKIELNVANDLVKIVAQNSADSEFSQVTNLRNIFIKKESIANDAKKKIPSLIAAAKILEDDVALRLLAQAETLIDKQIKDYGKVVKGLYSAM